MTLFGRAAGSNGDTAAHGRPRPFAIYYGWPSLVNGCADDVEKAVRQFSHFDAVIFGGASPTSAGDPLGAAIARRLPKSCNIHGYLSLGHGPGQPNSSLTTIRSLLAEWAEWGATGVLLDCAGRDFGVSAWRLNRAVAAAHVLGMTVVVNAWDPTDVEVAEIFARQGDAVLAENDVLRNGELRAVSSFRDRLLRLEGLRIDLGFRVWATGTTSSFERPRHIRPELVERIARRWIEAGSPPPDLLAVNGPLYSADNDLLPLPWPDVDRSHARQAVAPAVTPASSTPALAAHGRH